MRVINNTPLSGRVLRRMIVWVAKELDLPLSYVEKVRFKVTGKAWASGVATGTPSKGDVLIRVGATGMFPLFAQYRKRAPVLIHFDWWDILVALLAHELWHLADYRAGRWSIDEAQNERVSKMVVGEFNKDRVGLILKWRKTRTSDEGSGSEQS